MKNIVAVAESAGLFNTLTSALRSAGLTETLQGAGPFTVFAPTDEAFGKLPKGAVADLLADEERLAAVLTCHVVGAKVTASDIRNMGGGDIATVNGLPVHVTLKDGNVFVDGAKVINADIHAANGVIHVINSVILPDMAPVGAGAGK